VHKASTALVRHQPERTWPLPDDSLTVTADTTKETAAQSPDVRPAFGAHFAEVTVDSNAGEIWVRCMIGVSAAGRVLNSPFARCQFTGGLIMGLGMARTGGSAIDHVLDDFTQNDLASDHVQVCADLREIETHWIDEDDPHLNRAAAVSALTSGEAWHVGGELMGMTLLGAQALLGSLRAEQGFREGFPVPSPRPVGRRVAQPVLPGHPKE
jgi:CO/xanthine dehydrogenase Mo-binding subunit